MRQRLAFLAGACLQGVVLGMLLFVALARLLEATHGVRIFRYQGF